MQNIQINQSRAKTKFKYKNRMKEKVIKELPYMNQI